MGNRFECANKLGIVTMTVLDDRVVVELIPDNHVDYQLIQVPLTLEADEAITAALKAQQSCEHDVDVDMAYIDSIGQPKH